MCFPPGGRAAAVSHPPARVMSECVCVCVCVFVPPQNATAHNRNRTMANKCQKGSDLAESSSPNFEMRPNVYPRVLTQTKQLQEMSQVCPHVVTINASGFTNYQNIASTSSPSMHAGSKPVKSAQMPSPSMQIA